MILSSPPKWVMNLSALFLGMQSINSDIIKIKKMSVSSLEFKIIQVKISP